mmetsp:Transcript_57603/g.160461  ORF Transcript_57603/g.160461 Transcript_57603/m.160461 type:complete len:318 (+) Transcript_57603:1523-2476(+)
MREKVKRFVPKYGRHDLDPWPTAERRRVEHCPRRPVASSKVGVSIPLPFFVFLLRTLLLWAMRIPSVKLKQVDDVGNRPLDDCRENGLVADMHQALLRLLAPPLRLGRTFVAHVFLVGFIVPSSGTRTSALDGPDGRVVGREGSLECGEGCPRIFVDLLHPLEGDNPSRGARCSGGLRKRRLARRRLRTLVLYLFLLGAGLPCLLLGSSEVQELPVVLHEKLVESWIALLDRQELLLVCSTLPELGQVRRQALVIVVVTVDVVESASAACVRARVRGSFGVWAAASQVSIRVTGSEDIAFEQLVDGINAIELVALFF